MNFFSAKKISQISYRVVQLDFIPEIEVFNMLFDSENRKSSIKHHTEYFNSYVKFSWTPCRKRFKILICCNTLSFHSTAIDTAKLKYTVDFFLTMRWYDLRIEFRDLNDIREAIQ